MIRLDVLFQLFKSAHREIKIFFSHFQWREVLIFLFFFFLSFVFWVLQSMREEYEIQLHIPVSYRDIPSDMSFVQTPPSQITARVRDKGSILLNYTLGRQRPSITVSVQDIAVADSIILLSAKDIEAIIMKQLIPTTNLLDLNPQYIEISYGRLKRKRLPIHFNGDIHTEPGFQVSGDIVISPSETEVFATDAVLSSLNCVPTVYTEINNGNKTITRKLELHKTDGATFVPDAVSVTIPIEEYTQKTFDIPIVCKNVPPGYTIRMFPSAVTVTCNVPLSLFRDLSVEDFAVETYVAGPEQNTSNLIPLRLAGKPDWAGHVSLSQDSIEFILEQSK
jgi:hypothetical protein